MKVDSYSVGVDRYNLSFSKKLSTKDITSVKEQKD